MERTGVAELKASLSEVLARVKAGQQVTITERGRPIALLTGVPRGSTPEALSALAREGMVRLPKQGLPESFTRRRRPTDREDALRQALADERASGR